MHFFFSVQPIYVSLNLVNSISSKNDFFKVDRRTSKQDWWVHYKISILNVTISIAE